MSVTSTTMTITAHFSGGTHSGSERFEAWLRSALGSTWERKLDVAIGGLASISPVITALPPGIPHDVACRMTRSGAPQAGSTSSDPMDWPIAHRQMAVDLLLDDPTDDGSFLGDMLGAPGVSAFWCMLASTPSDQFQESLRYEFEARTTAGPGAWGPVNGFYDQVAAAWHNRAYAHDYGPVHEWAADAFGVTGGVGMTAKVEDFAGQTIDIRVRRITMMPDNTTVLQTSNWLVFPAEVIPA